ncbi:MAG: glycosyltransferase family 4 protein [Bacteroidales bacterium]
MKVAYYLGNNTPAMGGAFTYSTALISIARQVDEITRIYVIHGNDNYDLLKYLADDTGKVVFVKDPVLDHKVRKGIYYLCFGLLALNEFTPSPFVNKVVKWINRFNPYRRFFNSLPVDLIHVPYCYMPLLECEKKMFISFHDLQELRFPDFFSSKERLYRAFLYKFSLEKSDHVIVSFGHIKQDIRKYFQVPEEKIDVCLLPFHEKFVGSSGSNNPSVEKTLAKVGVTGDFLLYPANTWPHKNHVMLIQAITLLKQKGITMQLVCTGKLTEHYDNLHSLIEVNGIGSQVIFAGLIADYDLMNLYQAARLVVIPSLYEAGSAPLFEAMKFLTPVICSNVTSLPETIQDPEFIFDPLNVTDIANKILLGVSDDSFRSRNIQNLQERLQYYNSIKYSAILFSAYQSVK